MNELNEKQLFTCTGFDFYVDRCEGCDKKPECEKYKELLNEEAEFEKGLNSYHPDPIEFYDFGDNCEPDCSSGNDCCRYCDRVGTCNLSPFNPDAQLTGVSEADLQENYVSCSESYLDCDGSCENSSVCDLCSGQMDYDRFPILDSDVPF